MYTNLALFSLMTIILKLSTFVSACLFVLKTKLVLMQNPRLEALRLRRSRVKRRLFGKKNYPRSRLMWEVLHPILQRCYILLYIAPLWRRYVHGRKLLTLISYTGALEQRNWRDSRSIRRYFFLLLWFLILQVRFNPTSFFFFFWLMGLLYSWDTVRNRFCLLQNNSQTD